MISADELRNITEISGITCRHSWALNELQSYYRQQSEQIVVDFCRYTEYL